MAKSRTEVSTNQVSPDSTSFTGIWPLPHPQTTPGSGCSYYSYFMLRKEETEEPND